MMLVFKKYYLLSSPTRVNAAIVFIFFNFFISFYLLEKVYETLGKICQDR